MQSMYIRQAKGPMACKIFSNKLITSENNFVSLYHIYIYIYIYILESSTRFGPWAVPWGLGPPLGPGPWALGPGPSPGLWWSPAGIGPCGALGPSGALRGSGPARALGPPLGPPLGPGPSPGLSPGPSRGPAGIGLCRGPNKYIKKHISNV